MIAFLVTSGSVGTALYFNYQNNRLNAEAYNFWLVRAMYPKIAQTIIAKLEEDPYGFTSKAEKEMEKQNAIIAARAIADEAHKPHKRLKRI